MAIDRVDVHVLDSPQRLTRNIATGAWDSGPAGDLFGKPVLVKIYADGVVGYGQIRPFPPGHIVGDTAQSMVTAITRVYGPLLLGRDLFDLEPFARSCDQALAANPTARAAIDIALHDAMGKACGVPVHKLLGGLCQPEIPLEWSVGLSDDPAKMVAEATKALEEHGITVLCLKAGDARGWQQDVKNFVAVRRALGSGVLLGVDPNTAWTVDTTRQAMKALTGESVGYLEQPIARRNYKGLAEIRASLDGIPLLADESLFNLDDAYALAEARAVDGFCIKLYRVGGLSTARKLVTMAEAAHVRVNAGGICALSQLEAAATAHLCASIPPERMVGAAEFVFGLGVLGPDPLVPETQFRVVDGKARIPQGAGLGVTVDEARLQDLTLHKEVIQ